MLEGDRQRSEALCIAAMKANCRFGKRVSFPALTRLECLYAVLIKNANGLTNISVYLAIGRRRHTDFSLHIDITFSINAKSC